MPVHPTLRSLGAQEWVEQGPASLADLNDCVPASRESLLPEQPGQVSRGSHAVSGGLAVRSWLAVRIWGSLS